jgi:hypothetical protein
MIKNQKIKKVALKTVAQILIYTLTLILLIALYTQLSIRKIPLEKNVYIDVSSEKNYTNK